MSEYRTVGTFNVSSRTDENGKTLLDLDPIENKSTIAQSARNITSTVQMYTPFNIFSRYTVNNGVLWGSIILESGQVLNYPDRQIIIIEATSSRVVFIKQSANETKSQVYLQSTPNFIRSITVEEVQKQAATKLQATKTLAVWEVNFLIGFIGASSWAGFGIVLTGDIIQQVIGERSRNQAYKISVKDIGEVDSELSLHAPVLRKKILEALIAGSGENPKGKAIDFTKTLASSVLHDEKTTGRIAGAIAAKYIINPKNKKLSTLFILQTILSQVATKSMTSVPPAAGQVLSESFKKLVPNLSQYNPNDPNSKAQFAREIILNMKKLGVEVSQVEAVQIINEIQRNPNQIMKSMIKLNNALTTLANAGKH